MLGRRGIDGGCARGKGWALVGVGGGVPVMGGAGRGIR